MEGRSVERTAQAEAVARMRQASWRLPALAAGVVLVLLAIWWWSRSGVPSHDDAPAAFAAPSAAAPKAPAPTPEAGGAMIVDAPEAAPAAPHAGTANAPAATPAATGPGAAPASQAPASASVAAPAAASATASTTGKPRAQASSRTDGAQARRTGAKDEEDLLGTLIGIIKQKPGESQPESMDALIARIQAENNAEAANRKAFDTIDQSASTQSNIQVQLRRCPAANTAQGLECRRKICAKMAGKDPACPAR